MTYDEIAKKLEGYIEVLNGIMERFNREPRGWHIQLPDQNLLNQTVFELKDVFSDDLGKRDYSTNVINFYNEGVNGLSMSSSYGSVGRIRDIASSALTWLRGHPEHFRELQKRQRQVNPKKVFVVHGHDDANKLRLERFLAQRLNLTPVILKYRPMQGRTLIEKFEQEADDCAYAIAIVTPDDYVKTEDDLYAQARPNVVFELGWFCGRIGRDNVCILFSEGTKIHSDLDGVGRLEFRDSIEEKAIEISDELKAAGLI